MVKGKSFERGAGILLPISSLPSNYGIGTFGDEAYKFVDQLKKAGQKYWQVLPIGPTSFGDSPYQSFSAFAGNPYFIDLDYLVKEKLITKKEIKKYNWGKDESFVDYAILFENRFQILRTAYKNSKHQEKKEFLTFCKENNFWLEDYSFYMALKCHFNHHEWQLWEEDIRYREETAINRYKELLKDDIAFWVFLQYKFYQQWSQLKHYANEKGIKIIGDIPLYVAMDSADVWVHGSIFELDERKMPIHVAGVPPDCFSETGQRWGNPLYNWNEMEKEDFKWWRERMKSNAKLYDIIRIDHFIGIVRYYSIPADSPTAMKGKWRKGPGAKLTTAIQESIANADIIAEDLGIVVDSVRSLMKKTGWPGMKVLEFAFDSGAKNEFLPHNYKDSNYLVYGGTHDNETLVGFFKKMKPEDLKYAYEYLNVKKKSELVDAIIRLAYASIASVAIFQMQDILKLDNKARMNLPSSVGINWMWRLTKDQFTEEKILELKNLAIIYGRLEENDMPDQIEDGK